MHVGMVLLVSVAPETFGGRQSTGIRVPVIASVTLATVSGLDVE
jgi:hypothetical protein